MALVRTSDLMYENNVDPTASENFAAGFKVGDDFRNVVTNKVFMCTGDGVWSNLSDSVTGDVNLSTGAVIIAPSATLSPASFNADQNDYNPTGWIVGGVVQKTILRLQSIGNNNITGLVASSPELGNVVTIMNVGVSNFTISDNDGASLAANRFLLNGNTLLNSGESATFVRDTVVSRWRQRSDYK